MSTGRSQVVFTPTVATRAFKKNSLIRTVNPPQIESKKESLRERTEKRQLMVEIKGEAFYVDISAIASVSQKFHALVVNNQLDVINPLVFEAIVMLFEGDSSYLEGMILPQILEYAMNIEDRSLLSMLWKFLASERRTSVQVQALCQAFSVVRKAEFKGDIPLSNEEKQEILANIIIALIENEDRHGFNKVVLLGGEEVSPILGKSVARIVELEHKHELTRSKVRCDCMIFGCNKGYSSTGQLSLEVKCKNCKTTLCSMCCRLNGDLRTCPGQIMTKIFKDIDPFGPLSGSEVVETTYSRFSCDPENEFSPSSPSGCDNSLGSQKPNELTTSNETPTPTRKCMVPQRPCIFVDDSSDEDSEALTSSTVAPATVRKCKVPQTPCVFVDDDDDE